MTTKSPTPEPPKRKSPAEFEALAEQHNARVEEVYGYFVREHETHQTLLAEENARHKAQLAAHAEQEAAHHAARKALIATAAQYGMPASHARALLRKA